MWGRRKEKNRASGKSESAKRQRAMKSCFVCWRALARQLPILYNREKKAKSVGCKIGDLRSKFAFNIRGLLNVETCAVDYGCL